MSDELQVERDGQVYRGWRTVEKERGKLYQTVFYGNERDADSRGYRPDQSAYMDAMAKIILGQLVDRAALQAVGRTR